MCNSLVRWEYCRQLSDGGTPRVPDTSDRYGSARGLNDLSSPDGLEATTKLNELHSITNKIDRNLNYSGLLRHRNQSAPYPTTFNDESISLWICLGCFEYERPADHKSLAEVSYQMAHRALRPNARFQPPLKAGATEERTLQAVGCKPMFGGARR